ncbi:MAG: AAA family ATPase, partial [Chloroflexi bacterium]|nr:AAA family ATPase [Chloroflexota bacterium]
AASVRCATSIQQMANHPVDGEQLGVRVGLDAGQKPDWNSLDDVGTPANIAERLCTHTQPRKILCSSAVTGLLLGRQAFQFENRSELVFDGMPGAVSTHEVVYEMRQPGAMLRHAPFVGRGPEIARLHEMLDDAEGGRGGLAMLVGEPGIGKTRIAQAFAEAAAEAGATVLWGRCYEGEWTRPFAPFAEAIEEYGRITDSFALREDLGPGAGSIARLAPELHEHLSAIPEPVPLQADEERFRLLDEVTQLLIAASTRAPLVLVLDDLHWADKSTIEMLRQVARSASRHRILLVGTYRDVELDRQHPLADALGSLRRETRFERLLLKGLEAPEVSQLMASIGEHDVPQELVTAIIEETAGNPFFVREVLLHLVEEGGVLTADGRWRGDLAISSIGIPEGVRQAIGSRLTRLSEDTNNFLTAASAFNGAFRFEVAASVARLDEMPALDAVDEALDAQIVRPGSDPDTYDFSHALIRHTLYTELSPSRQVRLHRQIAEVMEATFADGAFDRAAELAYQYHRSAALPGAERGVPYAVQAADTAEGAYAHDDVATFLRMALELLPVDDAQRSQLLGRLGLALAWSLDGEAALKTLNEAADAIAASKGDAAAADYLVPAARTMYNASFVKGAWDLAAKALEFLGERRDASWASMQALNLLRDEAEDTDNPGIPLDSPERQDLIRVIKSLPSDERPVGLVGLDYFRSRAEILADSADNATLMTYYAGEYRRGLVLWQREADRHERQGQIADALSDWAQIARCHNALGDLTAADAAINRAATFASRLPPGASPQALQMFSARLDLQSTLAPESTEFLAVTTPLLKEPAAEHAWAAAVIRAIAALAHARQGDQEDAIRWLTTVIPSIERAPGWGASYILLPCLGAATLWTLKRDDHASVIERNLRDKVIEPDFRFPMQDGRLAMAQLCAVQGRFDEAADWFRQARTVLDEQQAQPLRAITDFNEAEMWLRRAGESDMAQAKPLLEAALEQFRALGMTGWVKLAERAAERSDA